MKEKYIGVLAVVLAVINFGVPYLVLQDVQRFTGNYLFWTSLAMIVILFGIWNVKKWGDEG
ncbi:MAG: hypothetical protein KGY76_09150 [Candidatus Thermoplasmatota archaeon]|nr:hypothetical protein [Candidatus Thermoplasmatota archaeon]